MSTGIMIIGPSGSGKTTLGKIVAQKLGYLYFDVDDYIWKQNTDSPYTQMYTREEKISRLNTDIAPYEHFVMVMCADMTARLLLMIILSGNVQTAEIKTMTK